MAELSIQIRNIREIQRILRQLPQNMKKEANVLIASEFKLAAEEAKILAKGSDYTGRLSNSISAQTEGANFVYKSTAPYSAYHEFGTGNQVRAAGIPRGFEPYAARFRSSGSISANGEKFWDRLSEWMQYRNIPVEKWLNIYRKIKKDGRKKAGSTGAGYGEGFFLKPYIAARTRIANGLKDLLAKAIR
jgi:phage gpG-like protein